MYSSNTQNKKPSTNPSNPPTAAQNSSTMTDNKKPPSDRNNLITFHPHHLFLYGTLTDPMQLRKVVRLKDTPALQPASISGWKIKLWGPYPALVVEPGNVIHGMAYEVQKAAHVEDLKYYETEVYRVEGCNIELANGAEVQGETFVYNGEESLLKEGIFDLKDWQMEQLEKSIIEEG